MSDAVEVALIMSGANILALLIGRIWSSIEHHQTKAAVSKASGEAAIAAEEAAKAAKVAALTAKVVTTTGEENAQAIAKVNEIINGGIGGPALAARIDALEELVREKLK